MKKFVVALALLGYVSSAKLDNLRYLPPDNRNLPAGGNHESGLVAPSQSVDRKQPVNQYGTELNTQKFGSIQGRETFGIFPAQKLQSGVSADSSDIAGNGFGGSRNFARPVGDQSNSFGSFQSFAKPAGGRSSDATSSQEYTKPTETQSNGFGSSQQSPNPTGSQGNGFEPTKDYSKDTGDESSVSVEHEPNKFQPYDYTKQSGGYSQNYEKPTGDQPSGFGVPQNNEKPFVGSSNGFAASQQNGKQSGGQANGSGSFQKYGAPSESQSNGFASLQRTTKPAEGQLNGFGAFQNYQKPSEGQTVGSGSFQKYEVPAEGQSNGFGSFQRNSKPSEGQLNGFSSFQSSKKPTEGHAGGSASLQNYEAPAEGQSNAFGSFQSTTKPTVGQSNGFGSFQTYQKPTEVQGDKSGSFQKYGAPSDGQSNAFGSFQNLKKPTGGQFNGIESSQGAKQTGEQPTAFKSAQYSSNQGPSAFGANQPSSSISGISEQKSKSSNNFGSAPSAFPQINNLKSTQYYSNQPSAFGNNLSNGRTFDDDTVSVEAPASHFNRPSQQNPGVLSQNGQPFSSNRQYLSPHSNFGTSTQQSPSFGTSPQSQTTSQVKAGEKKFGSLGFLSGQSQTPAQQSSEYYNNVDNSNKNVRLPGPAQESQQAKGQNSPSSGASSPYRYDVPSVSFTNFPTASQRSSKPGDGNQFNSPKRPEFGGDKLGKVGSNFKSQAEVQTPASQFQTSLFRNQPAASFGSAFGPQSGQNSVAQKSQAGVGSPSFKENRVQNQQAQDSNGGYLY
ncbi:filaggrin-2-like [Cylas formicarius]|uniref:filaggrin-2-like n=1 Tax=Cylas formicarius TaxID=197179 RepID=UPI00295899AF|nr:filaggrin-2-like [Cylas formicarius]